MLQANECNVHVSAWMPDIPIMSAAYAGDHELWPVVISSSKASPVQQQRLLYESILAHERAGAAVVERPLSGAAMCLTASVCLLIWTEKELQVESCHHH